MFPILYLLLYINKWHGYTSPFGKNVKAEFPTWHNPPPVCSLLKQRLINSNSTGFIIFSSLNSFLYSKLNLHLFSGWYSSATMTCFTPNSCLKYCSNQSFVYPNSLCFWVNVHSTAWIGQPIFLNLLILFFTVSKTLISISFDILNSLFISSGPSKLTVRIILYFFIPINSSSGKYVKFVTTLNFGTFL